MVFGVFIIFSKPIISADLHRVQTPPAQNKEPEKMIEDGMKMILNALQLILKSLPQYKAPEVLGNGDIIIRRVQPREIVPDAGNKSKKGIWTHCSDSFCIISGANRDIYMGDKTYDEWCKIVNDKFDEIEDPQWSDISKVAKEVGLSFSEVFEMLGYKDHFDFAGEDIGNDK